MACAAVAEHAPRRGGVVVVTANGRTAFEIAVRPIGDHGQDPALHAVAEAMGEGKSDSTCSSPS